MELSIHHLNGLPNGHLSNPNHPTLVIAFKPLQLCDVDCLATLIQMEWNCMKSLMKWLLIMKILLQDFWRDGIKWLPMDTGRDLLLLTFLVIQLNQNCYNKVLSSAVNVYLYSFKRVQKNPKDFALNFSNLCLSKNSSIFKLEKKIFTRKVGNNEPLTTAIVI